MSFEVVTVMHSEKAPADGVRQREELVRRVASSVTFEKSPRLRAFFPHVCRCARENKSEEATEPQIAILLLRPSAALIIRTKTTSFAPRPACCG